MTGLSCKWLLGPEHLALVVIQSWWTYRYNENDHRLTLDPGCEIQILFLTSFVPAYLVSLPRLVCCSICPCVFPSPLVPTPLPSLSRRLPAMPGRRLKGPLERAKQHEPAPPKGTTGTETDFAGHLPYSPKLFLQKKKHRTSMLGKTFYCDVKSYNVRFFWSWEMKFPKIGCF